MKDDETKSLTRHLYAGDPGPITQIHRTQTQQVGRITAIDANRVTLDRPLRFDLQPEWDPPCGGGADCPQLRHRMPADRIYRKTVWRTFYRRRIQRLQLLRVFHCWARGIRIHNSDRGGFVGGHFSTVTGLVFTSDRPTDNAGNRGHHGLYIQGNDNLLTDLDFQTRFIHDISVSHGAANVISNSRGVDMNFDHHKRTPYANVWTNIGIGKGTRPWASGGGRDIGRNTAAHGTFWNIRADRSLSLPPREFGVAQINFVAVEALSQRTTDSDGRWIEPLDPGKIHPQNIHEAQLELRLKNERPGN